MRNGRTGLRQQGPTKDVSASRKTTPSDRQSQRLPVRLLASLSRGEPLRNLPVGAHHVLWLQRTAGNRALERSMRAHLPAAHEAHADGSNADPMVDTEIEPSEEGTVLEAAERDAAGEGGQPQSSLIASRPARPWARDGGGDRASSLWAARTGVYRPALTARSWGAAAGLVVPQLVSRAEIEARSRAETDRTGSEASGPPTATSLATINKLSARKDTVGWTYFPKGYKAPNYNFNSVNKSKATKGKTGKGKTGKTPAQWFASPTLKTKAYEGDATSFYVSAGRHKTALKEGGKQVYWNFSAAMSTRDRDAEQEHCDDTKFAYEISLQEASEILTKHVVGVTFGPKPTQAEAETMVLDTIKARLTHAQLGNDKTKWAAKYDTLFRKTLTRDTSGWHTFGLANRTVNKAGEIDYDIVTGTTNVGTVASKKIITY